MNKTTSSSLGVLQQEHNMPISSDKTCLAKEFWTLQRMTKDTLSNTSTPGKFLKVINKTLP